MSRSIKLAGVCVLCLLVPACGASKITKANYDKVQEGMTLQQVEGILGSGDKAGGDGSNVAGQFGVDVTGGAPSPRSSTDDYAWESGQKKITITFSQGKVIRKTSTGL